LTFNPSPLTLEIIYQTDDLIAINKPHGLLVHKSPIAADATEFAVQLLRDQIGQRVYPVHRLDRKTSGLLLFAKSGQVNAQVQQLFREGKVKKIYKALVRGFAPEEGFIDYALKEDGKTQEAQTRFRRLQTFEIPLPFGKFPTSRYSLVELQPLTGRYHQLRKHMAHIFHPIIGDRPHGCNKQNRLWKEQFSMTDMLLHAESLSFDFPAGQPVEITAEISDAFRRALRLLDLSL
jgi:tRNA pseudouridine65 synthase